MELCGHYDFFWMVAKEFISPGAIIIAAFIGWCIQRKLAARKATLGFVLKQEVGNMKWRKTRREVYQILDSKEEMEGVISPKDDEAWERRFMIGSFLSGFEFIGAAIKNKTMDEKSYVDWNGSAYVSAWKKSKTYICRRRCVSKKPDKYALFEEYAKKWEKLIPVSEE